MKIARLGWSGGKVHSSGGTVVYSWDDDDGNGRVKVTVEKDGNEIFERELTESEIKTVKTKEQLLTWLRGKGVKLGAPASMRFGQDPNDKGRTMKEVSDDLQNANQDEPPAEDDPNAQAVPKPGPKTPEEMASPIDPLVTQDDTVTGN